MNGTTLIINSTAITVSDSKLTFPYVGDQAMSGTTLLTNGVSVSGTNLVFSSARVSGTTLII